MMRAKNCKKLPKFVKVIAEILSVIFSGHSVQGVSEKSSPPP